MNVCEMLFYIQGQPWKITRFASVDGRPGAVQIEFTDPVTAARVCSPLLDVNALHDLMQAVDVVSRHNDPKGAT